MPQSVSPPLAVLFARLAGRLAGQGEFQEVAVVAFTFLVAAGAAAALFVEFC
ncbi:hypothetical protein [Ramlibacter humi]|uniref:hypothetical protein n=1 Tax=Ramlibacter humi TaxID=2530451 RepID=UPI0014312C7B|nr:hypothetical protein [Ramlibacter humi]